MNSTWLLLGSNEGDRMQWMQKALTMLSETGGRIVGKSSVYETGAWGKTDQPDFLNMVVQLATDKSPVELLNAIHDIETALGRQREIKWGPRTLDIDILLFNTDIVHTADLTIPHPFMQERRFTLLPLAEMAPDYIHPVLHKTIAQLLAECPDHLEVRTFAPARG